jgi:hypothetical protein
VAKLTMAEAARVADVARSTLYRAVHGGRLSLDPDGLVDTAELLRAGYTLHQETHHTRDTTQHDATPGALPGGADGQDALDLLLGAMQRERDLLRGELDATRELLQQERALALERERAAREREAQLCRMLTSATTASWRPPARPARCRRPWPSSAA